jgi:thiamine kinase-like enzyme
MECNMEMKKICHSFEFEGEYLSDQCNKSGHINDTFIVSYAQKDGKVKKYTLQRINTNIFKAPDKLMENMVRVTNHIKGKVMEEQGDTNREVVNLVKTKTGHYYHKSEKGDCFRAYVYIDDATTYQVVEEPEYLYNSGKAFGKFQEQLKDFPIELLHETIPNFHDTKKRYEDFLVAVKNDVKGRVKGIEAEINFLRERAKDMTIIVDGIEEGQIPLKVTHNDTKFNNVIIDKSTGEAICVIDLDTVMPGSALYDFGDAIRSGAATAEEDEMDLSIVAMSLPHFECFTKGFLETAGNSLNKVELEYLPLSAILMTLECGMRFLEDYLKGDVYFKIDPNKPEHNLDRARNQFKMVEDMEDKLDLMKEIVMNYSLMTA